MDWPADKITRRKVSELTPYANNARTHSDAQVKQLMASIEEWGWTIPVLIDEGGGIIAGHGRILAAERLGIDEVPTMTASGWSAEQKRAYVLADNQLALNAGWDAELLKIEMDDLKGAGVDLDLLGFGGDTPEEPPANYSRKIEAPIYEVNGEKPSPADLYETDKTDALIAEIAAAGIPDDIAAFLYKAAERHTVFNFSKIADFYAHTTPEVQSLMERSALVIIDYERAIENGFVSLCKGMMDEVRKIKSEGVNA